MKVAVMGCVVNGPGEAKGAHIGLSLPGTGEHPSAPVYADGEKIMLKNSSFSTSTGDEAGSVGGVVSNCTKGKAQFILYSFDIKAEGQNVPRNTDMMKQNGSGSNFNAVG